MNCAGDAMVHTYRNDRANRRPVAALLLAAVWVGVCAVAFGWATHNLFTGGFTWDDVGFVAVVIFAVMAIYVTHQGTCREIRLSDDGSCELETRRGVIRLHVSQITAVDHHDDGESPESYTIRYRGGKVVVGGWLTDCPDFFGLLEALNPAVDLSGLPSHQANATTIHPRVGTAMAMFRSALFPLVVIIFIALVAWQTLSS
jgi:hypothetical protein